MPDRLSKRAPGRPPLEPGDPEATRHHILQSAMELFHARDYADVTMSDIAEAAGLTKATLYYHFRSKSEVLTDATIAALDGVYDIIHRIFAQPERSVRERLAQLLREWREQLALIIASQKMIGDTRLHLGEAQQQIIDEAMRRLLGQFETLMIEGIQRGELRNFDPLILTHIFQQMMSASLVLVLPVERRADFDQIVLGIFFDGAGSSFGR